MAKKSQRRALQYERGPSGCMWGLINMFNFRQVQSTKRLVSDKRIRSRHTDWAGNAENKLALLTYDDQKHQSVLDGEESAAATTNASKPSVKILIEEEMVGELDQKQINDAEVESKQTPLEDGKEKKKKWVRSRKSRAKSGDIHVEDLNVGDNMEAEHHFLDDSDKKVTNVLDIDSLLEEFCCQIHQNSVSCSKHDRHSENNEEPKERNLELEEKLIQAIKLFINEKLTSERHALDDGDSKENKELSDALQFLSSDQELFLKLLQDQKSAVVKYFQNLWNAQSEKHENPNSFLMSNLFGQGVPDFKQSEEDIPHKHRKFFRRKSKSMDENSLKEIRDSPTNTIVILKPGPTSLRNHNIESDLDLSLQSEFSVRRKAVNEKAGSRYLLAEIKRRFTHAMRKERQGISGNWASMRFPTIHRPSGDCDKGLKENAEMNSSSKDRFFIEKAARSPRKVEKASKLNGCETSTENKTTKHSKAKESSIYIEAKKHLSEILSDGAVNLSPSRRQVSLGRILRLPEYNSSPISSPARDWGQSFVRAQTRPSAEDKFQKLEDNQPYLHSVNTDNNEQVPSTAMIVSDVLVCNSVVEDTSSIVDDIISEAGAGVAETSEIVVQRECNILDTPSEPDNSSIVREDEHNNHLSAIYKSDQQTVSLNYDSNEQIEPPSSPMISPLMNKASGDMECAPETPERPSPISVLEPIFSEEDISPASIISQQTELLVQPLRIQFEKHDQTDERTLLETCKEDKEMAFEYVKAVLRASGLTLDELLARLCSSDQQLLDPTMSEEVEFFPTVLCCDDKLLFDCINEVLVEVYSRYFVCFLGLSFIKPMVRPLTDVKDAACEIWEGVYWHLHPLPLPHTLDQLVKKDMEKTGTWMDLRYDVKAVVDEISEAIFDDMMEEAVFCCCLDDWSYNGS